MQRMGHSNNQIKTNPNPGIKIQHEFKKIFSLNCLIFFQQKTTISFFTGTTFLKVRNKHFHKNLMHYYVRKFSLISSQYHLLIKINNIMSLIVSRFVNGVSRFRVLGNVFDIGKFLIFQQLKFPLKSFHLKKLNMLHKNDIIFS